MSKKTTINPAKLTAMSQAVLASEMTAPAEQAARRARCIKGALRNAPTNYTGNADGKRAAPWRTG